MDVTELLERLGQVEPVDPVVLDRTARELRVAMAGEDPQDDDGAGTMAGDPGPADPGPATRRTSRRRRRSLLVTAAAVVVLVVVVVEVPRGSQTPISVSPSIKAPSWRLVNSVVPAFQALGSGGQTGLECVTDDVCYSPGSGSHGDELYRTANGGRSWHEVTPLPMVLQEGGYAFSCSDAETCTVASTPLRPIPGELAHWAVTTDGGRHWSASTVPLPTGVPNASIGSFVCVDGKRCVVNAVGRPTTGASSPAQRTGTFLTTSDGGKTWTQSTSVPAVPAGLVWTMNCTAGGSCLAVSLMGQDAGSGVVGLSSSDWGRTWTAGPRAPAPTGGGVVYASCGDARHCLVVFVAGPSSDPYEIIRTSDAGLTWQESGPPAGWLNMPTAVSCATGDDCWIAMSYYSSSNPAGAYSKPTIEETYDGGVSWSSIPLPVSQPPIADVLSLSCPPSGDGCMGIGNRADHFVPPPIKKNQRPKPLSGPLVISNLPGASS